MTRIADPPLNLLDPLLYAGDPAPAYRWLRDEAPAYWDPVSKIWGISRHRDVLAVERDSLRYSSARGPRPGRAARRPGVGLGARNGWRRAA